MNRNRTIVADDSVGDIATPDLTRLRIQRPT